MTEKVLTDDQAAALYGTTDLETGVVYPSVTASNWGPPRNRTDARMIDVARLANALRVYPVEGDPLAVGVRQGRCVISGVTYAYAGEDPAVSSLTNNDTTYIWAQDDGGGSLEIASAIDATGWPTTKHLKLAEITTSSGEITGIVDRRSESMLTAGSTDIVLTITMAMAVFGAWAIDGDGAATNGGGLVGDALVSTFGLSYNVVWDEDQAEYQRVFESSSGAGYSNDLQMFPDTPAIDDAVYFAMDVPFCEFAIPFTTPATYSGNSLAWEYWNGTSWTALTLVHDNTNAASNSGAQSFQRDGAIHFIPPADWATTTVNDTAAYWIRCRVTAASITTVPISNSAAHKRVSPRDGWLAPEDLTITAIRAVDATTGTLHAANPIKFILMNFTSGAHTGELTWATGQRADQWTGLSLACAAGDELGVLVTQEDGTDEPVNVMLELTATVTG